MHSKRWPTLSELCSCAIRWSRIVHLIYNLKWFYNPEQSSFRSTTRWTHATVQGNRSLIFVFIENLETALHSPLGKERLMSESDLKIWMVLNISIVHSLDCWFSRSSDRQVHGAETHDLEIFYAQRPMKLPSSLYSQHRTRGCFMSTIARRSLCFANWPGYEYNQ